MIARPQADLLNMLPLAPAAQQFLGNVQSAQAPRFDAVLLDMVKESKSLAFQGDLEALNPKVFKALEVALSRLSQLPVDQLRQMVAQGSGQGIQTLIEQAGTELRLDGPQLSQLKTLVQAVMPRLTEQMAVRNVVKAEQLVRATTVQVSGPQGRDTEAPQDSARPLPDLEQAPIESALPAFSQEDGDKHPELAAPQIVQLVAAMQAPVFISTRTSSSPQEELAPTPVRTAPNFEPQGRRLSVAVREDQPSMTPVAQTVQARQEPFAALVVAASTQAPRTIVPISASPQAVAPVVPAPSTVPPVLAAQESSNAEQSATSPRNDVQSQGRVIQVSASSIAPPENDATRAPVQAVAPSTVQSSTVAARIEPTSVQANAPTNAPSRADVSAPRPAVVAGSPEPSAPSAAEPRAKAPSLAEHLNVTVSASSAPLEVDESTVVTLRGGQPQAPQTPQAARTQAPSQAVESSTNVVQATVAAPVQSTTSAESPSARPVFTPVANSPVPATALNGPPQDASSTQLPQGSSATANDPAMAQSNAPAANPLPQGNAPVIAQATAPVQAPTVARPEATVQTTVAPTVHDQVPGTESAVAKPRSREASPVVNEAPASAVWRPSQADASNFEGQRFSEADVRELARQAVREMGMREAVLQQVTEAITGAAREVSRLVIKLKPASLGAIEVELKVENGRLVARLVTSQADVRDVIAGNLATFKKDLESQGLLVRELSVAVKAETQSQGQPQQQSQPSWLPQLKKQMSQMAQNTVVLPQVFVSSGPAPRFSAVA